ncbi:competence protein ComGF [Bacillus sp. TS-2]|nr:competence protein ComGF [Bacillus sp. TS-2]
MTLLELLLALTLTSLLLIFSPFILNVFQNTLSYEVYSKKMEETIFFNQISQEMKGAVMFRNINQGFELRRADGDTVSFTLTNLGHIIYRKNYSGNVRMLSKVDTFTCKKENDSMIICHLNHEGRELERYFMLQPYRFNEVPNST